jgi:hypothetical protein
MIPRATQIEWNMSCIFVGKYADKLTSLLVKMILYNMATCKHTVLVCNISQGDVINTRIFCG